MLIKDLQAVDVHGHFGFCRRGKFKLFDEFRSGDAEMLLSRARLILYGTDSLLYFAPIQRARIDCADISDGDKKLILCDNAKELFGLS